MPQQDTQGHSRRYPNVVVHPPAGTFCRYAPQVSRTIRNDSDGTVRALLIGVPVDSGYQRMPWG